jgi:hypothetical protein
MRWDGHLQPNKRFDHASEASLKAAPIRISADAYSNWQQAPTSSFTRLESVVLPDYLSTNCTRACIFIGGVAPSQTTPGFKLSLV